MGWQEEGSARKKCSMNSELEKARGVNITQGTEEYLTPSKALGVYGTHKVLVMIEKD